MNNRKNSNKNFMFFYIEKFRFKAKPSYFETQLTKKETFFRGYAYPKQKSLAMNHYREVTEQKKVS